MQHQQQKREKTQMTLLAIIDKPHKHCTLKTGEGTNLLTAAAKMFAFRLFLRKTGRRFMESSLSVSKSPCLARLSNMDSRAKGNQRKRNLVTFFKNSKCSCCKHVQVTLYLWFLGKIQFFDKRAFYSVYTHARKHTQNWTTCTSQLSALNVFSMLASNKAKQAPKERQEIPQSVASNDSYKPNRPRPLVTIHSSPSIGQGLFSCVTAAASAPFSLLGIKCTGNVTFAAISNLQSAQHV